MFTLPATKSAFISAVFIASAFLLTPAAHATNIVAKATITDEFNIHETGISVFPGAKRLVSQPDAEVNGANIDLAIGKYGLKVSAVKLISDASPANIATFYKQDLQRHGDVLDCSHHAEVLHVTPSSSSAKDDTLPCESRAPKSRRRNGETVTYDRVEKGAGHFNFRVGNKFRQHIVVIRPRADAIGETEIALVHVDLRLPEWMTDKKNRTYISFEP